MADLGYCETAGIKTKEKNIMKIIREGKEIELTSEELASAHAEFVIIGGGL